MHYKKVMVSLLISSMSIGVVNATVIENIREASAEEAKKFNIAPKIVDMDGKKVFATPPKSYLSYVLKKRIKVNPSKKYHISAKVKQLGKVPALVCIGFIPYNIDGRVIDPRKGYNNTKGSLTALVNVAKYGTKTLTVKDASRWAKDRHYVVAFNAKEDMSDIPNFDHSLEIAKIEKIGDVYTITLKRPLTKAYPAGTKVRQHRSGGTYIYTKVGRSPKEWTVWKGMPVQGKYLRKAVYLSPIIMINAKKEGSRVVFTDFVVEEL